MWTEHSPLRKWSWWQFPMQLGGSEPLVSCRPQETEITTWPRQGKLYPKHIHLSACSLQLSAPTKILCFVATKECSPLSMTHFQYKVLNESVNNITMFLWPASAPGLCWRQFIRPSSVAIWSQWYFAWLIVFVHLAKMIFPACKAYQQKYGCKTLWAKALFFCPGLRHIGLGN